MLNLFLSPYPKPKQKDLVELCKEFHRKSNGSSVYPKLVSMLSIEIERVTKRQQIERVRLQTQEGFTKILEKLQNYITLEPPPPPPPTQALLLQSDARSQVLESSQSDANRDVAIYVGPLSTTGQTSAVTNRQSIKSGTVCTAQKYCDCSSSIKFVAKRQASTMG